MRLYFKEQLPKSNQSSLVKKEEDNFRKILDEYLHDLNKSETKTAYTPKNPETYKSEPRKNLKEDHTYHSNSNRSIGFMRAANGRYVPYIPMPEDQLPSNSTTSLAQNTNHSSYSLQFYNQYNSMSVNKQEFQEDLNPYKINFLRQKLHNPKNNLKRNSSEQISYNFVDLGFWD